MSFGNYSVQIQDPKKFFVNIVGTSEVFTTQDLHTIINSRIIHPMSDYFAESKVSYNEIDSLGEELGHALCEKIDEVFITLGFILSDFRIEGTDFDDLTKERIGKNADTQATHYAAQKAV